MESCKNFLAILSALVELDVVESCVSSHVFEFCRLKLFVLVKLQKYFCVNLTKL